MKKILLILLIFSSCKSNFNYIGEYYSEEPNLFSFKSQYYLKNIKMKIMSNQEYTFQTCSQISYGKWNVINDTLFLNCVNIKFLLDSFNNIEKYKKGLYCKGEVQVYKKNGRNKLIGYELINNKKYYIYFKK